MISLALEFLYQTVGVIHGDISLNNIMINRVWKHVPGNSPSRLRIMACSNSRTLTFRTNRANSACRIGQVSTTTVIQTPTTSTTVVQASVPSTTQGPTTASTAVVHVPATSDEPATSELIPSVQVLATSPALTVQEHSSGVGIMVDYKGTTEHIESAGMVIDCDFMRYAGQEINLTSVRKFSIDTFNCVY